MKLVLKVKKQRIAPKRLSIRADVRNHHKIRRILNELAGVTMVRMVVPGTVRHDDIGAPSANLADDLLTGIQGRSQLAVSIRENFSLGDPQAVSGFLGLPFADC